MEFVNDNMNSANRICVVVLGDLGRSPRMQYHSVSLAAYGFNVDLVGYKGSRPHEDILTNKNIKVNLMDNVPNFGKYMPSIITYCLKVMWQTIVLLSVLLSLKKPTHVLMQNPPSIPSLPIVWFYCWIRGCKFVIDWHNYGYTILSLTLNESHPFVKICRWTETYFGSKADYNLCVTRAMRDDLKLNWKIEATVLYDRPPMLFRPISLKEKHKLFMKLKESYAQFGDEHSCEDTTFTYTSVDGTIKLKPNRPALVISSTSWTADEDFSILLESLIEYDRNSVEQKIQDKELPKLLCVITGKGPMKEHFEEAIKNLSLKNVEFILPWLEAEDYPKMLASADVGVCLHTSSSGLDLPMKVVDMFGCCLPVAAIKYNCIDELVKHEENGLLFETSSELSSHLQTLLGMLDTDNVSLKKLRDNLSQNLPRNRWNDNWRVNALPIFDSPST